MLENNSYFPQDKTNRVESYETDIYSGSPGFASDDTLALTGYEESSSGFSVFPVEVLSGEELLASLKPMAWVINGLIPRGSLTILFGSSKTGKTHAGLHLCACIAAGRKWLDFNLFQGNTLYIDEEGSIPEMANKYRQTTKGLSRNEIPGMFFMIRNQIDMTDSNLVNAIINQIWSHQISFVVFDALIDISGGANENNAHEMYPIMYNLKRIAVETNAAVVVIHHAGKNGSQRGSTVIESHADLVLKVDLNKAESKLTFKTDKARFFADKKFAAYLEFEEDSFQLVTSKSDGNSSSVKLSKSKNAVLKYLADHGPTFKQDIISSFVVAKTYAGGTITNAIGELQKDGFLTRADVGGKREEATIALADNGIVHAQEHGWLTNEDE